MKIDLTNRVATVTDDQVAHQFAQRQESTFYCTSSNSGA